MFIPARLMPAPLTPRLLLALVSAGLVGPLTGCKQVCSEMAPLAREEFKKPVYD